MLENKINEVSDLLKSISHPLRLRILCLLLDKQMTNGEIQTQLKTSHANISQHLTILRRQGIVSSEKNANFVHNMIKNEKVVTLMSVLQNLFCQD